MRKLKRKTGASSWEDLGCLLPSNASVIKWHVLYDPDGNAIAKVVPDSVAEGAVEVRDSIANDEFEVGTSSDGYVAISLSKSSGKAGDTVTVTFTPNAGRKVDSVTINGVTETLEPPMFAAFTRTLTIRRGSNSAKAASSSAREVSLTFHGGSRTTLSLTFARTGGDSNTGIFILAGDEGQYGFDSNGYQTPFMTSLGTSAQTVSLTNFTVTKEAGPGETSVQGHPGYSCQRNTGSVFVSVKAYADGDKVAVGNPADLDGDVRLTFVLGTSSSGTGYRIEDDGSSFASFSWQES